MAKKKNIQKSRLSEEEIKSLLMNVREQAVLHTHPHEGTMLTPHLTETVVSSGDRHPDRACLKEQSLPKARKTGSGQEHSLFYRTQTTSDPWRFRLQRLDDLLTVHQNVYRGQRDFDQPFRALVVGASSVESLISLAVQIESLPNAHVMYFDRSAEWIDVVRNELQQRARLVGLPELERVVDFQAGPVEEMIPAKLGLFDYISSCDVLHYPGSPLKWLRRLRHLLKPDGAMGITAGGRLARVALRHLGDILTILSENSNESTDEIIHQARLVLKNLPASSALVKSGWKYSQTHTSEQIHAMLHEGQCRTFTLSQLYRLASEAGLFLSTIRTPMLKLRPEHVRTYFPESLWPRLDQLTEIECARFLESFFCLCDRIEFYLSPMEDAQINPADSEAIPSYSRTAIVAGLTRLLRENPDPNLNLLTFLGESYPNKAFAGMDATEEIASSYQLINDQATMGEIATEMERLHPSGEPQQWKHRLLDAWKNLIRFDLIRFRHSSSNISNLRSFYY